jgi:hypothetical protein
MRVSLIILGQRDLYGSAGSFQISKITWDQQGYFGIGGV